ncbi:hypothetical protein MHYP_G00123440 [Metynnis hypsauchen]
MKNAKSLCKKHIPKHYRFGMHVIGLLTSANTMVELEEMVTSATVVISSPCVGENVEKHFQNIKTMLAFLGDLYLVESKVSAEDLTQVDIGDSPFVKHLEDIIQKAPLDLTGDDNTYHSVSFIRALEANVTSCCSVVWPNARITPPTIELKESWEKIKWDLKQIRFQRRRLTRLDDYQHLPSHPCSTA